jgi:methionyl-tRNA formyltransferase
MNLSGTTKKYCIKRLAIREKKALHKNSLNHSMQIQNQHNKKCKIRVGLLLNELSVPFWSYALIKNIIASNYAEVVLIVRKNNKATSKKTILTKLKEKHGILLYKYYEKLENRYYKPERNAFEKKALDAIVQSIPILNVDCIEKKFSDYIKEEDIETISEYKVDVFIRLGFRILRGPILKAAKFGVWSYHHGDNYVHRGGPAGFWEKFSQKNEIGSTLQVLTEDLDGGDILYRSWSSAHLRQNEILSACYWKTSLFISRKLKELYNLGEENFLQKQRSKNNHLHFYSNPLYKVPTNYTFIKLCISQCLSWIKSKSSKIFSFEQWILLYSFTTADRPSTSIFRYKRLTPSKDRFWADPCVILENGKYFIFFEEFLYKGTGKGHISVMEIDKKGVCSPSKIVLSETFHLSYPFVFKYEGNYYMIPESKENSTIKLYKATNFPYEWNFVMNLMDDVKAVDTTIFFKDDKVWLFTNRREIEGTSCNDELYLFFSDTLLSKDWTAHPCNPIVSDVKSARAAGKLFYHNGILYRPSQDCSYKYGFSIVLNEVTVMNESEYEERRVSGITPNWANDVVGTHTLSFDHGLSVIDAAVKRRKTFFN